MEASISGSLEGYPQGGCNLAGARMIPIEFDAIVFQEGTSFIAYCPELDISSCGHDVDQARHNLKIAVRLFIEEAQKLGTLDDILKEAGYQRGPDGRWKSPRIVATEVMSVAAQG